MIDSKWDYEVVSGIITNCTDKALLIDFGYEELWVPRSVILDGFSYCEFSEDNEFEIADWFCEKEGLL